MSIGHQITRALTEQFYLWELRGRGWGVWPVPVALEPPFRPFEGHFLPRQLTDDDGRTESFGSRFAGHLGRFLGFAPPPPSVLELPEEIEEPDAEEDPGGVGLVELQIALPPEYQPHANVFEQFLGSIGYSGGPVAFEVVGKQGELVVQVTTRLEDSAPIREQLKAFFPEGIVVTGSNHLASLFEEGEGWSEVMDFGLEREFMVPVNNLKALATDPLVAVCGALDRLGEDECGVFQVLLEPARRPWSPSIMRAVSLGEGRPFFANDPELLDQARQKVSRPLYAAVVRVAARADTRIRTKELLKSLAGALRPLGNPQGNQLLPLTSDGYEPEDHLADLVNRQSRRCGMILNSDELIALAHLPTAAVRAKSLRRALKRTKAAPAEYVGRKDGVCIGTNEHEGVLHEVRLPDQTRLNHCHILGATGSGKSSLLGLMAGQDIVDGRGVAVIDPHGDLIDLLIPHIPPGRMRDVVLFDPTDEEYAIAFNPLAAASDREKDLLATDFIAVMKQHTSGWGDQMSSLLGNAVLAFLSSTKGGTLPELRRFLADPGFRTEFLKSVTSTEVVYFWENEAGFANKSAIGSILTRLDSLLRYESLLHILGQRANRLDFADIMDSGKIFLARLAKGLIGAENAFLLGGLLVSRFYQTTIARQARSRDERLPYFLIMDEAGDLLTSTVGEILKGTRKYGLGLTLAHQTLGQLRRDEEIYGAVTGNCGIKVCFQVGGDDARKMAEEFGGFVATDLMNLEPLNALVRIGPRDCAFNLKTRFVPEAPRPLEAAYAEVQAATRAKYSTPRATIRAELAELRKTLPPCKVADPFAKLSAKRKKESEETTQDSGDEAAGPGIPEPKSTLEHSDTPPKAGLPAEERQASSPEAEEERESALAPRKAESIKNAIAQAAGAWGFSYETEKPVNNGTGRVDIVLTLGTLVLACEISATTNAEYEFERSIRKCLQAGFARIFLVCDPTRRREAIVEKIQSRCTSEERSRIECLTAKQFQKRLVELAEKQRAESTPDEADAGKTIFAEAPPPTMEERKTLAAETWEKICRNMRRHGNSGKIGSD